MKSIIKKLIICLCAATAVTSAFSGEPVTGEVNADKLNVRIRPETAYSAVTLLKHGDKVKIYSSNANWYCIEAPQDSAVWIGASFIDHENGIVLKKAYLRAGPGITYESYLTVMPGEKLSIQDKSRPNWIKVASMPSLRAWVNKNYIKVSPEDMEKIEEAAQIANPEEKPATDAAKPDSQEKDSIPDSTGTTSQTTEASRPIKDESGLPFVDDSSKITVTEGIIYPLSKDSVYVTHALTVQINNETYPIAYLHSSSHNLSLWEKRKVRIKGQERWVKDWKRPVLEVETISPSW